MTISNTIRKTGNVLLLWGAMAALFNCGVAYARVSMNSKLKAEFDKAPVLGANDTHTSKAYILGEKLPYSNNLPFNAIFWGTLMGLCPGKKGKGGRG